MIQRAFLSVETSLTGRRWIGPGPEAERLAEAMAHPNLRSRPVLRRVEAADGSVHEVFAAVPWLVPEQDEPMRAPALGQG